MHPNSKKNKNDKSKELECYVLKKIKFFVRLLSVIFRLFPLCFSSSFVTDNPYFELKS